MDFSAPDITAVSNPNRKPPRATTMDQARTECFFIRVYLLVEDCKLVKNRKGG
jgi:hypothetical protein